MPSVWALVFFLCAFMKPPRATPDDVIRNFYLVNLSDSMVCLLWLAVFGCSPELHCLRLRN